MSHRRRTALIQNGHRWLSNNKIKAFYDLMDGLKFDMAARALFQASGIGKMKPNVLMMGYKGDWRSSNSEDLLAYFNVLQ